jgi:hypothetical protein
MPQPGSASLVTVTETYVSGDGTAETGTVTFTPTTRVYWDTNGVITTQDPVVAQVVAGVLKAADGTNPLQLPATDDPDGRPSGWAWNVVEAVGSKRRPARRVLLPASPSTRILHTLSDVEAPATGLTRVLSVNGVFPDASGDVDAASGAAPVTSVAGRIGAIVLTKSDVGLSNVDNTADAGKPVSTATQTALDAKAPIADPTFTGTVSGVSKTHVGLGSVDNTSDAAKPVSTATQTALDAKAPLASPTFTGTVSGVTKAMVGLGSADNTSDANKPVSTATQTALDLKAPLASPTFTGTVAGISKTMVGLGNVDNTSDANKPVSTAQAAADAARALKLVARVPAPITSGNIQLNTGTNTWGPLTGSPTLAIPAAVGDLIVVDLTVLRQANANIFLDVGVVVTGAIVRYLATMTSTPAGEGDPGLYHTALPARSGSRKWVAESGDISGGTITITMAIRNLAGSSSLLLASTDNPYQWSIENRGPSTTS